MSRLTQEQIKKLTPAKKKERNKMLAYLAERRAAKRDGKFAKRVSKKASKLTAKQVTFKRTVIAETTEKPRDYEALIELTNSKLLELKSVYEREVELKTEILSLVNSLE